jgi:hypothetical protein
MDHHEVYMNHATQTYGKKYASVVRRFQDGFLADRVCKDVDKAFCRAVETTERLIPVIKA